MKKIVLTACAVIIGATLSLSPYAVYAENTVSTTGTSSMTMGMQSANADQCAFSRSLSVGTSGDDVICLQRALISDGLLHTSATGMFGGLTKAAVQSWQKVHGIPTTGVFGPMSRGAFGSGTVAGTHPLYQAMEDSHKAMMAAMMSTSSSMAMAMDMPDNRKVIAVMLYDQFEPLDAIGPLEVLGQMYKDYKVVTVAKQKGEVASAFGTKIVADYSFDELKNPAIIVVPGGLFGTIAASKDPATLAWLREADKTSEYTTSVCTGAWILAAAGFLNGREASTHWTGADYLEDFGVKYTGKRYTVDGKYVTAAGVSAGIDMSFKLVAMIGGDDAAKIAELGLEYDPQPPFDAGSPAKADPALVKIMRDEMKDHIMAANMMYGAPTTTMPAMAAASAMGSGDMHMDEALDVSSWPSIPSLTIQLHPDPMGGYNLEIQPQNFRFAPEHAGGASVPNEGHGHILIDGIKVGRAYGNWYYLSGDLFNGGGRHTVTVELESNDHRDLMNGSMQIVATTSVIVK